MNNVQCIVNPAEEWDYDFHVLFLWEKVFCFYTDSNNNKEEHYAE